MCDVLLKLVRTIHVVIVGVVPDDDTRILNYILYEAKTWKIRVREGSVRVGPGGDLAHDGKVTMFVIQMKNALRGLSAPAAWQTPEKFFI